MKTITQVDPGRIIYAQPENDGSREMFILPEGAELTSIGKLMPTMPDSRQQPKSLAQRMLEDTLAKRRAA